MLTRQTVARILMFISVVGLGLTVMSANESAKNMHTIFGPILIISLYILISLLGRATPHVLQPNITISPKIRSRSGEFYINIEINTSSWHDYGDAMIYFDYYDKPFAFNKNRTEVVTLVGNDNIRLGCLLRAGKSKTDTEIKVPVTARNIIASGDKDKIYVSFHFKNLLLGFQFCRYLHLETASIDAATN